MKIKSVHNEMFIFDSSKMFKVKNKHLKFSGIYLTYHLFEIRSSNVKQVYLEVELNALITSG